MQNRSFKDLQVWQRSRKLAVRIYSITKSFPKEEMFGLTSQLKRSGVSIPSNIAEGHRRGTDKEFLQFLNIARGSLAEVETQIIIANDIKFIDDSTGNEMLTEINEIGKMINGLMSSLTK